MSDMHDPGLICPNCLGKLRVGEATEFVTCPYCDTEHSLAKLLGETSPRTDQSEAVAAEKNRKTRDLAIGFFIVLLAAAFFFGWNDSPVLDDSQTLTEEIAWTDLELGHLLPAPPDNMGQVFEDSSDQLYVVLPSVTGPEFDAYAMEVQAKGFNEDATFGSEDYFDAFNGQGYEVTLTLNESFSGMVIDVHEGNLETGSGGDEFLGDDYGA